MTRELFEREKQYTIIMTVANSMCKAGAFTQEELNIIDGYFREKYKPVRVFSLDNPANNRIESSAAGGDSRAYNKTG